MKTADITFKDNQFFIKGDLDFSNVMSVYTKSLELFNQHPNLLVDFTELKSSDSSGLALIIEWLKLAKKEQKKIAFNNISDDLHSIAKVASLDELLISNW